MVSDTDSLLQKRQWFAAHKAQQQLICCHLATQHKAAEVASQKLGHVVNILPDVVRVKAPSSILCRTKYPNYSHSGPLLPDSSFLIRAETGNSDKKLNPGASPTF